MRQAELHLPYADSRLDIRFEDSMTVAKAVVSVSKAAHGFGSPRAVLKLWSMVWSHPHEDGCHIRSISLHILKFGSKVLHSTEKAGAEYQRLEQCVAVLRW